MRIRFPWIAAILALLSIGFILACSTKYSSSSNGLLIVPSRDSLAMETFSINLSNGHASQVNNVNGPPINGLPSSVILDPAGAFAYVLIYQDPAVANTSTGIETFPVAPDGKLMAGITTPFNNTILTIAGACESIPVTPVSIAMDSAGKFLFVANSSTTDASGNSVPGSVSVFAIGGGAGVTEVSPVSCTSPTMPGSPFPLPMQAGGSTPSASALAVTPTVFPVQFAPCSGTTPPASENLYVTDSVNYLLFNYMVTSTGSLSLVTTGTNPIPTGTLPSGVAVDPCNRFAYVANTNSNTVSAYTVCSVVSPTCLLADDSLQPVTGSPFPVGDLPGPIATDAYGNFLYVVNTGSSNVSAFSIGSATGHLTVLSPATVATNLGSNSIAVRSDDSWLFVANSTAGNVSQFSITPATGSLTMLSAISTFNLPSGVAVK